MAPMRVHLGSDHAGYELKAVLVGWLGEQGHEAVDHGAHSYQPDDDYPGFCIAAAEAVLADPGSLGIVIGGSGNGEAIAANKVIGARCALAFSVETATLARQHNDANLLSLGARMYDENAATAYVAAFLGTPFSTEPRHARRIAELTSYEERRGG